MQPHLIDDSTLDALDANRLFVDSQNTRALAWSRADAPRELGEIVRHKEPIQCIFPLALEEQIVPFGNDIRNRTSSV